MNKLLNQLIKYRDRLEDKYKTHKDMSNVLHPSDRGKETYKCISIELKEELDIINKIIKENI